MQDILNHIAPGIPADATALFGAVFFVFMFVFFSALTITDIVQRRADIRKRTQLDRVLTATDDVAPEQSWEAMSRSLRYQSAATNAALLSSVERGQKSVERESETSKLRRELVSAGFFGANAVAWFQGVRFGLGVALPFAVHLALAYVDYDLDPAKKLAVLMTALTIGFFAPTRYLKHRQGVLQQECRDGFPDFMDLMVICAEAGLAPRAAIDRISREISHTYPYLGANIYLVSLELRAGGTLALALGNLARRTNLEEVFALGSLLQQTEQLGTSISDALRIYSDEMRDKRLSRAEEKAYALPVKLTLPLGLYVFPVMLVVVALPVLVRIQKALF
jgi:tight adherence protein C